MADFLDQAPLSEMDKDTIRDMAVTSPVGLMGGIQASPDAFRAHFGEETTDRLTGWLEPQLSEQDKEILHRLVRNFPLGAIVARPAPPLQTPDDEGTGHK